MSDEGLEGYSKEKGEWAFSCTSRNEIWLPLIEKGWAKLNGRYSRTIGGNTAEGLGALTGAPCERIKHEGASVDELWEYADMAD